MKLHRSLFAALCLAMLSAPAFTRAEDAAAVIAKARAYLGSETVLTKVQSVRYVGTVEEPAATAGATATVPKVLKKQIDVIFQSPYLMRQTITEGNNVQITGLDGYGAWVRAEDKSNPLGWRVGLLPASNIIRMRANTWENLSFYRGLETIGGHIEDAGTAPLDGKTCRKLIFRHTAQIAFTRWFDATTGQLILTETDDGTSIREEGELVSGGLRFPKKIVTTAKNPDGTTVVSTIVFDKITLNELAPPTDFYAPLR